MSFPSASRNMDAHLIKTFGEPCAYTPVQGEPANFDAVIEHEVSLYAQYTDIASGGVVITCLTSDMPNPRNGDQLFDAQARHWKILKTIENDGNVITVSAVKDPRSPDLT